MNVSKAKILIAIFIFICGPLSLAQENRASSIEADALFVPETETYSIPMNGINGPVEILQAIPAGGGGAWAKSGVGPTLYQKGWYYYLKLNPPASIPATSKITNIYGKWSLSYRPSGLVVYLCHNTTSTCLNVTSYGSIATSAFGGLAANKPMIYVFYVQGTGVLLKPAYGQSDQVIVNYN